MATIGIMVEGQEDMTWRRFFRLAAAVETLGFESLFRSDHLTALNSFPRRASLALWPSLTALAMRTERIRFGPLVCPMTFRHPVIVAKMAAAVDQLSAGRLDLGLGAGWFAGEHQMFGIPYPRYPTRLKMLEEGVQVIRSLWSGEPAHFHGRHYRLQAAENHPPPRQQPLPIIMGGKGERTLQIAARWADEWNCAYSAIPLFREKSAELDRNCEQIGRDPASLRRSLMIPFVIGRDAGAIQDRIDAHRQTFPDLPGALDGWWSRGYIGGEPTEVVDQLAEFVQAGVERFMLQHNDLDDLASLELLASDVLPHFSGG